MLRKTISFEGEKRKWSKLSANNEEEILLSFCLITFYITRCQAKTINPLLLYITPPHD